MRTPRQNTRSDSLESETMTPMIDVVFLLLVFFVCASVGQTPDRLLPATLSAGTSDAEIEPEPAPAEDWDHQQVRIHLGTTEDNPENVLVRLNEQPVKGLAELEDRLRRLAAIDPLSFIILDVEDSVRVQEFISIYDLCRTLRFERIAFATRESP